MFFLYFSPATPKMVADEIKGLTPTTPEKLRDVQKEESTPVDDVRVQILPDDKGIPTAPQPKVNDPIIVLDEPPHQDINNAGGNDQALEEFVFDEELLYQTPPLPRQVETELRQEPPAVEQVIEKVPDPIAEDFEKDLKDAERTVAKTVKKASTRIEGKKRNKKQPGTQHKKVVVNVEDGQIKPSTKEGRKSHHADKRSKIN